MPFTSAASLDENDLCSVCRLSVSSFDSAYAYGSYEGPLQKLVQLFKYGKVESLAQPLSRLLLQAIPFGENFDAVMPVPMHWFKQWQRGFNQAELLAAPIARRYGLKVSHQLQRARYAKAQASLNFKDRQKNMRNSFVVRNPAEIKGKRILIVDDVLTTGATLRAAAAALKSSGAKRVTALTLARVDQRTLFSGGNRQVLRAGRQMERLTSSALLASEESADRQRVQTAVTGVK